MAKTALESLFDGSKSGKRNQVVLTSRELLDPVDLLWGQIYLDNCWAPGSLTNPVYACDLADGDDGLDFDTLPSKTFTNPPFGAKGKDLPLGGYREFLDLFSKSWETMLLGPVRTHRDWYRAAARSCSRILWMQSYKFHGFKSAFPAPLALLYRGDLADEFEILFDSEKAPSIGLRGLGTVGGPL